MRIYRELLCPRSTDVDLGLLLAYVLIALTRNHIFPS